MLPSFLAAYDLRGFPQGENQPFQFAIYEHSTIPLHKTLQWFHITYRVKPKFPSCAFPMCQCLSHHSSNTQTPVLPTLQTSPIRLHVTLPSP